MNLCKYLPRWLQRILHCRRIIGRIGFAKPVDPVTNPHPWRHRMTTEANITARTAGVSQTVVGTATFTVDGVATAADNGIYNFTIEDSTVAIVLGTAGNQANVQGVADPSGTGTKQAKLSCAVTIGGQPAVCSAFVNVTTVAPNVVGSIDFADPVG